MFGVPIAWSLLAVLLAGGIGLSSGWHYGGKVVRGELDAALAENQRLAAQVTGIKRECADAIARLKRDAERRKQGAKNAADEAAAREAQQRGVIGALVRQATSATDSAQNCDNATAILNKLAKEKRK